MRVKLPQYQYDLYKQTQVQWWGGSDTFFATNVSQRWRVHVPIHNWGPKQIGGSGDVELHGCYTNVCSSGSGAG